jgi:hypothetical protein
MSRPSYAGLCTGTIDWNLVTSITATMSGGSSVSTDDGEDPPTTTDSSWSGSSSLTLTQALMGQSVPQYPFYCTKQKCCSDIVEVACGASNPQGGTESYSASGTNPDFSSSSSYYLSFYLQIGTNGDGTYGITITPGDGPAISDPDGIGGGLFDSGAFSGDPTCSSGWTLGDGLVVTSDPIAAADLVGTHTCTISFDSGSITFSVTLG